VAGWLRQLPESNRRPLGAFPPLRNVGRPALRGEHGDGKSA